MHLAFLLLLAVLLPRLLAAGQPSSAAARPAALALLLSAPLGWLLQQGLDAVELAALWLPLYLCAQVPLTALAQTLWRRPSDAACESPDTLAVIVCAALPGMGLWLAALSFSAWLLQALGAAIALVLLAMLLDDLLARLPTPPRALRGTPLLLCASGLLGLVLLGLEGLWR